MKMSQVVRQRVRAAAGRAIESLESRTFLSATLTSPISSVTVTQDSSPTTIDLNSHFNDPAVTGPTVNISTPEGSIPMELFPTVTPLNVANFLGYVDSGEYNGTIVHRNAKDQNGKPFVIQGGGYTPDGTHISTTRSGSGVADEFHFSNTRGTVAMAKTSAPNSATSEWFVNESDANSFLDAQNFTVFGRVLYSGMSTVDAIAALSNISATNLNGAFTDLPVISASGGAVASNMVTTTISRTPHIVIANPVSDNPGLVTATLGANNQLVLSYGAGQSGFAHITVVATDLGGNTVSQTFRVHVTGTQGTQGVATIGTGGVKSATWTQPDGTIVTATLKGPGTATLTFASAIATTTTSKGETITGTNLDPDIAITGGTGKSTLTITAKGGAKIGRIGNLTTDADFGTINAKGINLDGDLTAAASLKSLTLNGASNGTITIGTGALALTMKTTAALTDELINSNSIIKSITTPGWNGTNNATSGLTAPIVGSITVKTAILNTTFNLTGGGFTDLGKLTVSGNMQGVFINAIGSLGTISAATMVGDTIFAGVSSLPGGQPLPNFPSEFASVQSIKAIKVKNSAAPTFSNTNIAAEVLGSMSLGRIQTQNGGATFGVAATSISSISGTDAPSGKKFSMHKVTAANIAALEAKLAFGLNDFVIKLF